MNILLTNIITGSPSSELHSRKAKTKKTKLNFSQTRMRIDQSSNSRSCLTAISISAVNSKLDCSDDLVPMFEVKSHSIVFVGAVDTIFLGMYRDLMFLFSFKK